jgi:hypothetical protein
MTTENFFSNVFGGLFRAIGGAIRRRRERKAREAQERQRRAIRTVTPGKGKGAAENAKEAAQKAARMKRHLDSDTTLTKDLQECLGCPHLADMCTREKEDCIAFMEGKAPKRQPEKAKVFRGCRNCETCSCENYDIDEDPCKTCRPEALGNGRFYGTEWTPKTQEDHT